MTITKLSLVAALALLIASPATARQLATGAYSYAATNMVVPQPTAVQYKQANGRDYRLKQRGYYGTPYGSGPQYGSGGGDQYGYGPGYSYARQAPN